MQRFSKELLLKMQAKGINGPPGSMSCESIYHMGNQEFYGRSEMISYGHSNPHRHCKSCANTRRFQHMLSRNYDPATDGDK